MSAPRRGNRGFFAALLLVTLLVAGFGSYYASNHPDGLNFVAQKTGFIDQEKKSAAAKGPFAGYATKGVDDQRLSGGIAGVAGCLLVLTIGGSLFWVLRRRTPGDGAQDDAPDTAQHSGA